MEEILKFLEAQTYQLEQNLQTEQFATLAPAIVRAYDAANLALPERTDLAIRKLLWLCHRSFMVAALLIARGHPDDAGPVTRRAIETARVAFALTYNRENLDLWAQYDARRARWAARQEGRKPPSLALDPFKFPKPHPVLDKLGLWLGIYSDMTAHFTPEYLSHYEIERRGDHLFMNFFVTDREDLDRALRACAAVHLAILDLFDEATKGTLQASPPWCAAMAEARGVGRRFALPEIPSPEEAGG
jgi:hypothetical protein